MKYFVKLAGKAFGPLEEEKIVEMYHNGRLKDPVEISRDKKVWDSIDIILPSAPPPDLPSVEPDLDDIDLIPDEGVATQKFADPSAPVWFYSVDGSKGYGPVTKSDLETMLQCGMLKNNSLVWRQGENSRPISVVPELMDIFYNGASPSTSSGFGGGFNPANPFSSAPNNPPAFGNSPFNSFPNQGGMASFHPGMTVPSASASTNMFDLVDDPNFGNDGVGQGKANNLSQTGKTSRSVYLLLALLLGQFGIHNFYANRMDVGIVQLFIGLTNLVCLIVIMFIALASDGNGSILLAIPALIGLGLQVWAIIEICVVTHDGTGRRMY